jgi:HD-GYP domain-containing protein (c-di-GMP phosphodiesterase class II)
MTSDRCYRAAGTPTAALAELRKRCWTQFDARVVAALERIESTEPVATDIRAAG